MSRPAFEHGAFLMHGLSDGLRLVGSGLVLLGASTVGVILGLTLVLVLSAAILACVPAGLAWAGFETLCDLRE